MIKIGIISNFFNNLLGSLAKTNKNPRAMHVELKALQGIRHLLCYNLDVQAKFNKKGRDVL